MRRCESAACAPHRHTPHQQQPAQPGSRLCRACLAHLLADLGRLPGLYETCGQLLGGHSPAATRERTSGGPLPGMPFNTTAADIRSAILGVLGSWARLVTEARAVTPPGRTARTLASFLAGHAEWLAAHPAAGDAAAEVAQLVRRAERLTVPARRLITIGRCPEEGCPGLLRSAVDPEGPHAPSEVRCDADPAHRWTGDRWAQLSRRLRAGDPGRAGGATMTWLTAADISRLWGVALGSVYRLAGEGNWRRRRLGRRTYYHEGDVRQTCEKRG
ncbi:hypothetical protein [Streptomyces chrestomyceticus]|uniref:hypothetical protein n=1 Tax=Streptomyces chrestomyceticus TaxID=68185 RepID=UPI003792FA80